MNVDSTHPTKESAPMVIVTPLTDAGELAGHDFTAGFGLSRVIGWLPADPGEQPGILIGESSDLLSLEAARALAENLRAVLGDARFRSPGGGR